MNVRRFRRRRSDAWDRSQTPWAFGLVEVEEYIGPCISNVISVFLGLQEIRFLQQSMSLCILFRISCIGASLPLLPSFGAYFLLASKDANRFMIPFLCCASSFLLSVLQPDVRCSDLLQTCILNFQQGILGL
ncbi:hypothetical protein CALCODRAFT_159418 [Calocera cornea HHB12733]|uniref:Uncharacterized protein n=1 Tax=Calocera cornea HHB12733 TaxID=1353952 RepID=A0A165I1Q7_9BASI|nr:hypothetical protein CALCODRAFT_159418 [Calocera cornea HHB12733]